MYSVGYNIIYPCVKSEPEQLCRKKSAAIKDILIKTTLFTDVGILTDVSVCIWQL